MALFDSYFDPSTYGGDGGLVGRLLSQFGTQSQYQQSSGFGPNPMDASASILPQQQNSPIAVGNYQMPRIGSGFPQIDPQTGETIPAAQAPLNAGMVQPQQPNPMLPQMLQPPQPAQGLGDRLANSFQSWAHTPLGNPMLALANGISSLATGQRTDDSAIAKQNLRSQYAALVPLVGERKAMLAVLNPEAGKAIMADAFGPGKFSVVQTGENEMGAKQYSMLDRTGGTLTPIGPATGGSTSTGALGNMNLTGKAYLDTLPKDMAGTVQAVVEGRLSPPTSFALAKPYWKAVIAAAQAYDPTFDATKWSGRVAGVKDFASGKSAEMVRSANQTIGHVGDLIKKMDGLANGQYPMKNAVGNYISSNIMGNTGVVGFQQNAHAVADELSKVFKGAGISDHEIKQWEQNLSPNMSPEQQRESISTMLDLLKHSLSALDEKRLASMGPVAAAKAGPLLSAESQRVLDDAETWAKGNAVATSATPKSLNAGESATVNGVTIKRIK